MCGRRGKLKTVSRVGVCGEINSSGVLRGKQSVYGEINSGGVLRGKQSVYGEINSGGVLRGKQSGCVWGDKQ